MRAFMIYPNLSWGFGIFFDLGFSYIFVKFLIHDTKMPRAENFRVVDIEINALSPFLINIQTKGDPFLTSDDPGGCDLHISMTSGGQNMKSMKISHLRS